MHALRTPISRPKFSLLALAATLALNAGCPGEEGSTTVSGRVTYDFVPANYSPTAKGGTLAFNQSTEKPVRNAVVQARQGTTVLASTNTDEQGNYELSFTPDDTDTAVTVVALAKTSTPSIQVEDNTDSDAIWGVGDTLTADAKTLNLHATHGWTGSSYVDARRTAAPFAILDSMYTASKAFMAVRQVNFPALKVNWSPDNLPETGDKKKGQIGTSHYSFSEKEIYVLGKAGVDTDEFDSHVIVHEWGHYFEDNLSRADSPGGPHSAGDVLDPRIAFGEGYGNAIAAMLLPEPIYTDTAWNGSSLGAFGFDAETAPSPTDDPNPGAFSEMSVLRILYDLYDSNSNESSYDQLGVGLGPIYDVLTGPQKTTEALTTIGSFITGLRQQSGVNGSAVNTLLAHYGIGPITTAFGDGDPGLRAMYTPVTAYPYTDNALKLGGGYESNKWEQNQYYVFTGNGSRMTITANSTSDVAIGAAQKGVAVGLADDTTSGTETFSFTSQPDVKYVLVVTGFEERSGDYPVSVSIRSP